MAVREGRDRNRVSVFWTAVTLVGLAGAILGHFVALDKDTAGYAILFGICATAYLVAFGLNHVLVPKFELVEIKEV